MDKKRNPYVNKNPYVDPDPLGYVDDLVPPLYGNGIVSRLFDFVEGYVTNNAVEDSSSLQM